MLVKCIRWITIELRITKPKEISPMAINSYKNQEIEADPKRIAKLINEQTRTCQASRTIQKAEQSPVQASKRTKGTTKSN
jgi:flagellar biosynthesis regulator FlbT